MTEEFRVTVQVSEALAPEQPIFSKHGALHLRHIAQLNRVSVLWSLHPISCQRFVTIQDRRTTEYSPSPPGIDHLTRRASEVRDQVLILRGSQRKCPFIFREVALSGMSGFCGHLRTSVDVGVGSTIHASPVLLNLLLHPQSNRKRSNGISLGDIRYGRFTNNRGIVENIFGVQLHIESVVRCDPETCI
jgi:hypothetical protein